MEESKKPTTEVAVKSNDIRDLAFPELTANQLSQSLNQLVEIMPEHAPMLEVIKESLPEIHRASSLHYKTQTQFMDNMLTVAHMTPLRNLRQILAQITRTRDAIKEVHHKFKLEEVELVEKENEIEYLEKKLASRKANKSRGKSGLKKWLFGNVEVLPAGGSDDEDAIDAEYELKQMEAKVEKLSREIVKIKSQAETTRGYISGAVRQLTNYTEQYNNIKLAHKIGEYTEADVEKEEEEYHIMKAFEQALCAARTRHDHSIDEGNMIYLTQIGINGAHAQFEIGEYLKMEQALLRGDPGHPGQPAIKGNILTGEPDQPAIAPRPPRPPVAPTHAMYIKFLKDMAAHFKGSAEEFAKAKGMTVMSNVALIQQGDTRLLLPKKSEE